MPKLPALSGRDVIRILTKIGFEHVRTSGSHAILRKIEPGKGAKGTLRSIIDQVGRRIYQIAKVKMAKLYEAKIRRAGLTPGVIREIKKRLEKLGAVKIKVSGKYLKALEKKKWPKRERKAFFKEIANLCNATLEDFRGYTLTLRKRKGIQTKKVWKGRPPL